LRAAALQRIGPWDDLPGIQQAGNLSGSRYPNACRDRASPAIREDLFYRLNVAAIRTPSLSQMREDIALITDRLRHPFPL
jgi:hypothetical protein